MNEIEIVPLSIQQQMLWDRDGLLQRRNITTGGALRVTGRLDILILRRALEIVCQRHKALLTRIIVAHGTPRQHVEAIPGDLLQELPSRVDDSETSMQRAVAAATKFREAPFDFASGPLFRCGLLKLGSGDHLLILAMDHIIGDGISTRILLKELTLCYEDIAQNRRSSLPAAPMRYGDYALWQRQGEAAREEIHGVYWKRRLGNAHRILFPIDADITCVPPNKVVDLRIELGEAGSIALRQIARKLQTTLARVVLGLYVAWIAVLTGSRDFVVPFNGMGRRPQDLGTVGLFAHILYLRMELKEGYTFLDVVRESSRELNYAYEHLDFGKTAALRPEFHLDARFQWEGDPVEGPGARRTPAMRGASRDSWSARPFRLSSGIDDNSRGSIHIALRFKDSRSGIVGTGAYRADLFKASTIARFSDVMHSLVRNIRQDPNCRVVDGGTACGRKHVQE
jgi:hypothetical protein